MFKKSIKQSKALFAQICLANKQIAKNREQTAKRSLPKQQNKVKRQINKGGSK